MQLLLDSVNSNTAGIAGGYAARIVAAINERIAYNSPAVSLQVAIRHPELVEKLVSASVDYRTDDDYPEVREAFRQLPVHAAEYGKQLAGSPLGELYPDADWEAVFRKSGDMGAPEYDWTAEVKAITAL